MFSFQGAVLNPFQETQWNLNHISVFEISVNLSTYSLFLGVVGQNGLEPSTSRLSVVCSSQLSYWPISASLLLVVEISGIEPLTSCLQGRRSPSWAKPPSFHRFIFEVVGQNGLEPSTSRLSVVCSSQLSYWPIFGHFYLFRFIFPVPSKLNNEKLLSTLYWP